MVVVNVRDGKATLLYSKMSTGRFPDYNAAADAVVALIDRGAPMHRLFAVCPCMPSI